MVRLVGVVSAPLLAYGIKAATAEQNDLDIVAHTDSPASAPDLMRSHEAHICLLDVTTLNSRQLPVIKEITAVGKEARVLLLGWPGREDLSIRLIRAGAVGYLSGQAEAPELIEAVRTIAAGKRYLSREFAGRIALDLAHAGSEFPHTALSEREYQVFELIVGGNTPRDIARSLGISVSTVNTHRQRLLNKMGMQSNAELVRYAVRNGISE
jgi:DNA-binding NarL/FixJ family response regulator